MQEPKFTSGNWTAFNHSWSDTSIVTDDDEQLIIASLSIENECDEDTQEAWEEIMAANAALIAAAPAMYWAMKEFCDRVERGEMHSEATCAKFKAILELATPQTPA